LDQVIENIQVELIDSIEHLVPILKPTQLVVAIIELSQPIQHIVELVQVENP
jgi:hypothetical protein